MLSLRCACYFIVSQCVKALRILSTPWRDHRQKFSYERRAYESVDDDSQSKVISRKTAENNSCIAIGFKLFFGIVKKMQRANFFILLELFRMHVLKTSVSFSSTCNMPEVSISSIFCTNEYLINQFILAIHFYMYQWIYSVVQFWKSR